MFGNYMFDVLWSYYTYLVSGNKTKKVFLEVGNGKKRLLCPQAIKKWLDQNRIQQPYPQNFQTAKYLWFFPPKVAETTVKGNKEMATAFISTANAFLPSHLSSLESSSSSPSLFCPYEHNAKRKLAICKAVKIQLQSL
jgi:hypothetical protein